ncbi:DnaJ domain-containing protein [Nitratireductor sp. XY-223]|uniref:DnaJ domain-containing protein n=1 Tax=Nitratireductor sp. XY-223 TaxID=2561926 RepID=UPI001FF060F5|nr:DnaJ domain-containing protein [Nitratireductor sp. XY-223]
MFILFYIVLAGLLLAGLSVLFLRMDPKRLAVVLRYFLPVLLTVFGVVFILLGRTSISLGLFGLAAALFGRARARARGTRSARQTSRVRTAALEMELDLDSGAMNGLVLAGQFEGRELDALSESELMSLHTELRGDPESVQVLEAYLDRRTPAWRDGFEADADEGLGAAPASGSMTEEEAYEILGLAAGASEAEIREAHRRLMKRVHPDTGGSVFLAARINEAKDVLLRRH